MYGLGAYMCISGAAFVQKIAEPRKPKSAGDLRPNYKRVDLSDSNFRLGFIAQEVEAAIPSSWGNIVGATEAVAEHVDQEGNTVPAKPSTLTLDYARLVCCLWQCTRSLLARVEALEAAAAP